MTVPVPASQLGNTVLSTLSYAQLDDPWGITDAQRERYRERLLRGRQALAELVSLAARTEEAEAKIESEIARAEARLARAVAAEKERDEAQDYTARAAVGNLDRARMPLPTRYWLDSVARADAAEARAAALEEALAEWLELAPLPGGGYGGTLEARSRAALAPAPADDGVCSACGGKGCVHCDARFLPAPAEETT